MRISLGRIWTRKNSRFFKGSGGFGKGIRDIVWCAEKKIACGMCTWRC